MFFFKKKSNKIKCKYDYVSFVKLDTYLFKLKNEGKASIVMRNGEPWFKWDNYYFYKGIWGNIIRKGSYRESDTIYKGTIFTDSEWIGSKDQKIEELFEDAIDYWDLNIG